MRFICCKVLFAQRISVDRPYNKDKYDTREGNLFTGVKCDLNVVRCSLPRGFRLIGLKTRKNNKNMEKQWQENMFPGVKCDLYGYQYC